MTGRSFSSPSCFFVSVTNPGHGDVDRASKSTGDYRCMARNNGARGGTRGRGGGDPNGQSDERYAIIASAKIGSR